MYINLNIFSSARFSSRKKIEKLSNTVFEDKL